MDIGGVMLTIGIVSVIFLYFQDEEENRRKKILAEDREKEESQRLLFLEREIARKKRIEAEKYEEVYVSDREWKHLEEPFLSNFQEQRRNYRKKFASIIEEGIQKNEIRKIDASTAVLIMLHAVSGIESWHRSTAKINAEELENNMVMIMIDGLRKQG